MNNYTIQITADLNRPAVVGDAGKGYRLCYGDAKAHSIAVDVVRGGDAVSLTGCTASAFAQVGSTKYNLTAVSISGNRITVTIDETIYSIGQGLVTITVQLCRGTDSTKTTVAVIIGVIETLISSGTGVTATTSAWTESMISSYLNQLRSVVDGFGGSGIPSHVSNSDIHVTAQQKARWNANSVVGDTVSNTTLTQMVSHLDNTAIHLTESEKAAVGRVECVSNANLLDNWYFRDPVNQRSTSSFSGAVFTVDRWRMVNSTSTLTVGSGIACNDTIYQYLPNIPGVQLTVSMLTADNTLVSKTVNGGENGGYYTDNVRAYVDRTNKRVYFRSIGVNIIAVKLEIGSVQTLAHKTGNTWVLNEVPDKGEQLRRCQRYYYKFNGVYNLTVANDAASLYRGAVFFPTSMYESPSVSYTTNYGTVTVNGTSYVDHCNFDGTTDSSSNFRCMISNIEFKVATYGG